MAEYENDKGARDDAGLDNAAIRTHAESPPSRPRSGFRWLSALAIAALIWIVAAGAVSWWALRDVPWQQIADGTLRPVSCWKMRRASPLVQSGPYQGAHTPLDNYPDHLVDAVLAIEDRRFFDHYGIDIRGITRAFVRNMGAGQVVEGGSTITQQLVKVLYLEQDRTLRRKIQETVHRLLARGAAGQGGDTHPLSQQHLSRGRGHGRSGCGARLFRQGGRGFDARGSRPDRRRHPRTLRPQSAPQSRRFAPARGGGHRCDARRWASQRRASLRRRYRGCRDRGAPGTGKLRQLVRGLGDGGSARDRRPLSRHHPRPDLPRAGTPGDRQRDRPRGDGGERRRDGRHQAALVAMAPDGAVLAMVGGVDYGESSFNRAVSAMRQPGSTFKLFVYYAALEAGIDPNDLVIDEPVEVAGWAPENFGGQFYGQVTVAEAFARSLNAATVSIAEAVGIDAVAETARQLGIDAPLMETPSLALGTSEVSLLDLTGAYASVRSGIAPTEPWAIASFRAEESGRPLRVGPARMQTQELGGSRDQMIEMMRLVVESGTGRNAATNGFSAGKTGTSQNFRDAWFVGFSENWVVGVWVGNDDGTPMNRRDRRRAARRDLERLRAAGRRSASPTA
jgi:penicillin-binding protein 1A